MFQSLYTTARLRLMAAEPSLAKPVAAFFAKNKAFLAPQEPTRRLGFYTVKRQKKELKLIRRTMRAGRCLQYWLVPLAEDRLLGTVLLNGIVHGNVSTGFLAYRLGKAETGNGYAREGVAKLIDIAFTELGLHRVQANVMPHNLPSLKLLASLGFQNEGLSKSSLHIGGQWEDHYQLALLNPSQQ